MEMPVKGFPERPDGPVPAMYQVHFPPFTGQFPVEYPEDEQ